MMLATTWMLSVWWNAEKMPPPAKLLTAMVGARDRTADKGLSGLIVR